MIFSKLIPASILNDISMVPRNRGTMFSDYCKYFVRYKDTTHLNLNRLQHNVKTKIIISLEKIIFRKVAAIISTKK